MEKNRYGHILTENFQEAVGAWIKNYSNNIAIIEGERKITYRELGNLIIRCRKFFFEQGVKKGDNIAVHMGNHSEFIMVFLSLVTMGAVPILILSAQKKNEVRGIVRVATPKLYIYDAAVSVLGSLVAEGNKELKGIEKTIFTSMLESSEVEKTKEETYKEQIVPEDLALLLLSGGTTGIPKLIPRTHGDYLYNVKRITERLKLTQESVFLSVLPMAHNFALGNPGILGTLCSGGTVVICNDIAEDVDIARLQKAIKNLVEEQEALRCTFHEDQYANVQESQEIDFTYYDLQILSSKEKDEKLEEIRKDLFERNFNINKGPLICFVATRIDDKKTIVHICHDGLVADGESHQIILKELENLYYGKQNASHCSFSEYTHYIKDMKENPEYSELLNEKVKRLSEFDTKPQLDALKDAKEVMKPNVGVVARIIPEDLYFKICEKGRENAVTPFSILLTAFGKALAKYSDNSKFLLNLPVSYRPMELEGVENLVGLCSNFILFGFDDSRSIGFLEQIEDNQNKLFSSREEGMLL